VDIGYVLPVPQYVGPMHGIVVVLVEVPMVVVPAALGFTPMPMNDVDPGSWRLRLPEPNLILPELDTEQWLLIGGVIVGIYLLVTGLIWYILALIVLYIIILAIKKGSILGFLGL
jgi:hypothetical protein